MTEKNPYENGVDIPDFVETKDEDVDLSVFKMSDDEMNTGTNNVPSFNNNDEDDEFDEEDDEFDDEEDEDAPKRKLSPKGIVVVGGILLVVLLVAAVVGWVYGAKQHSAYVSAAAQVSDLQSQVDTLQGSVDALTAENESLKAAQTATTTTESSDGTSYKVVSGMNVRKGPGTSYECVSTSALNGIDGVVSNGSYVQLTAGTTVKVYETKEDGNMTWGRIATDAWICLVNNGTAYATAE